MRERHGLVMFEVSLQVGGRVGVDEFAGDDGHCRGEKGKKEIDSRSGGTRDKVVVFLDDNGFLCRG